MPRLSFKSALDAKLQLNPQMGRLVSVHGSKAKPAPSSYCSLCDFKTCRNFATTSRICPRHLIGLSLGRELCIDIAIPRLFACAESECSICSVIQSGVKIFENGSIAENRGLRPGVCLSNIWCHKQDRSKL